MPIKKILPAQDRALGCFMGMAIGDALGAAVEFRIPGSFPAVTGYRKGTHDLRPGQWTDDTIMGWHLAKSLLVHDGFDSDDILSRWVTWMDKGKLSPKGYCFDIGGQTSSALRDYKRHGWLNAKLSDRKGNGSIMRLAAVPLAYRNPGDAALVCVYQGRLTHNNQDTNNACAMLGRQLSRLINGQTNEYVLPEDFEPGSSGEVNSTLASAMWAVGSSTTFREAVLKAVNLGMDSDTIGAVAGMLAGATWGLSSVPKSLLDGLWRGDELLADAKALWNLDLKF